jgi:deazaflavin-dependent oxidoreductase (nitroreductase family)
MKAPRFFWRVIHYGPRIAYALGFGPLLGRFLLLLTTHGRKSGLPRVTPLTYEKRGEVFIVASARGASSDWLRNIQANPTVTVRVGNRRFEGIAQPSTDPEEIADYIQHQFDRNPRAFGAILRAEGLPTPPSRADLVRFAPSRPMVLIRPIHDAA